MNKETFKRRIRKITAFAAAVAMAATFTFPAGTEIMGVRLGSAIVASAATVDSGDFGSNNSLHWELDDTDKLTISGTGAMGDWPYLPGNPWNNYRSSISSVEICDGVTYIGEADFYNCSALTRITIPNSVTSIGVQAFCGCGSLTSVTFGGNSQLTSIGQAAFSHCKSLASITIPSGVTSIGESAFYNCSGLTSITIPDSVTSIGDKAFSICNNLTSIFLPEGANVTSDDIPDAAAKIIYNVDNDNEVTVTEIIRGSQTSVTIPDTIGGKPVKTVYIDEALTGLDVLCSAAKVRHHESADGDYIITNVTLGSGQTSFTIPYRIGVSAVASIENSAFSGCTSLETIFIPDGLNVSNAGIPASTAQIKYIVSNNSVTITQMSNVTDGQTFDIPETISGYPVVSVAGAYQQYVGNHTHTFDSNNDCTICGGSKVTVTSISVDSSTLTLSVGQTDNLIANVQPPNATDTSVEWTSSDTAVATVDTGGKVTAVGKGTATIKAAAKDGSGIYGECAVTVHEIGTAFTVTATNGGNLTYGSDYTYENGVLTIKTDTPVTIKNTNPSTPTTDRIEVESSMPHITLAGVNIDVSALENTVAFKNNSALEITLAEHSVNKLKSGSNCAGLQMMTKDNRLHIKGEGELIATGGDNGAGIGGGDYGSCSGINITGGTVIATGSGGGAGIGGGYEGKGLNITITSGTVTATGSGGGAGIGGGYNYSGSHIDITGGTVTATGGDGGAGIGGGYQDAGSGILIKGGTVTATGSGGGAGIGGGYDYSGSDITITGGTVTATGSGGGAGIGGGVSESGSGINITGGTVTATGSSTGGSNGGAGIGGGGSDIGVGGSGSGITISGGSVKAVAGENANAIGGGNGKEAVIPTNGTINVYLLTIANPDGKDVFIDGSTTPYKPSNHSAADTGDTNLYAYLTGETHKVKIGDEETEYKFDTNKFLPVPKAIYFTFTAPTDLVYDGNAKTATVEAKNGITGIGTITVKYYDADGNKLDSAPVVPGTYTVKIDVTAGTNYAAVTDLTADSWKFSIDKATPNVTAPTATAITLGQTLADSTLSDSSWSWSDSSIQPTSAGTHSYTAVKTVDDANYYDYTALSGFTFNSSTNTLTTEVSVVVNRVGASVTPPTASNTLTYGQALSAAGLTEGWTWENASTVPDVNNTGFTAYKIVTDYDNYDYSNLAGFDYDETTHKLSCTVAVTVNKATPTDATTASQSFTKGTASTAFAAPVFKGIDNAVLTGSVSYTYGGQTYTTTATLTAVLDSLDGGASGTISYNFTPTSANYTTASGSISFSVIDAVVTGITLKSAPTKTTYEIGDTLDLTGGKITVSYNNGTSADIDITAEMISGFDSTTAGEKTVTVTYSGFTATFKVTVSKGTFTVEPTPGNMEGAKIDMTEEELYNAVLTPEDKALIEQGVDIAVLMTVITINPSSVPANDVTAIANVMGDFELGCYIDVSLFKKYSNSNTEVPVTDTYSPITISFKVPADILAQYPVSDYEYSVFCSHNGVGYPITCSYNAATNVMSFSSTMFSTYALAVKSRTPAAVDYTITADSHVTVQSTAQAGDIVSVTVEDGYKATVTNSLGTVITTITGTGSFVMPESNVTITSELINTHVHDYSTEWKTDSTSHWYECECGDRVNVAAHVSNGGIVTVRPTETTEGVRTYSCSICGYVMRTETIPTLDPDHSHSYDTQWKSDSTSHWHECDCGEKVDISNHISDGGVVTVAPTETGTGIMTYSCSICGYILRTETIPENTPVHTHNYGTAWDYDSTCHWHECSCGDRSNIGQHISNGGIVTVQPTATSTGLRVYSCSVCGYVLRTETIPATGYNYPNYPTYPTYPTYPFDSSIFNVVTFTDKVNVTAETEGNTITIKWDKVEKADKYYVYQYKNGKYVKVKTTSDTSATFKNLKNGETYKFLIRYTKSGRLSPTKYSGTISVKVYYKPIPKPTATKNSIKLTWEAIPEAEKYAIYKYVDGKAVKLTETKKLSVKIGKLIPDTEYKYIVRAYVDGKWTTMLKSDIVTVKTTAE